MKIKGWVKKLLISLGIIILGIAIEETIRRLGIIDWLIYVCGTIRILDKLFLLLFSIVLVWLFILNRKLFSTDAGADKGPRKIRKIIKRLNEEKLVILSPLSEAKDFLTEGALFGYYRNRFPEKGRSDFKYIIKTLSEMKLMKYVPIMVGDDNFYEITDLGLAVIRQIKEEEDNISRSKKSSKK